MRRNNATSSPRKRWHSAVAPASLWLAVFSLSLLGPLVCIIHCVEAQRATHSGSSTGGSQALFTCQLFGDNTPSGRPASDAGQHSSAPILPESPFLLLRAYYVLLVARHAAAIAPLLFLTFVGARSLRLVARVSDAPPTPPPRLA